MCGVAYLYNNKISSEIAEIRLGQSLELMRHRGPDDGQVIVGDGFAIGHRRLSIIDLSNSSQPMISPDNRYFLSFNGEIYNYQLLREELKERWIFKTQGDTEVLLAGLVTVGLSFIEKLEGMWAFVLWDDKEKTLLLSRDRFGKKPLYYIDLGYGMAVASEIPALKRLLPDQPFREDLDSTADLIRYGFYMPGKTILQNVQEVLPANVLVWTLGEELKTFRYWTLDPLPFTGSRAEAVQLSRELFKQSVRKRLVADVEVGAFLSGGIDSSITVATLVNDFHLSPRTYTIGFDNNAFDESRFALQVAAHLNVRNKLKKVHEFNCNDLIGLLQNHVGQPFGDASILPTALVASVAANDVKVALTGDGADEVFSGYQRYQARLMFKWFAGLPKGIRELVKNMLRKLPASHSHHSRSILKKAQLFVELVEQYQSHPNNMTPRLLSCRDEKNIFPMFQGLGHQFNYNLSSANADDVVEMMLNDINVYLPQDILVKTDRASMAHSVELRSPFLDHKLVQFAFSLPRTWHRRRGRGKCLLRDAFLDYLPNDIWKRRKQGFSVPVATWFMGEMGKHMLELIEIHKKNRPFLVNVPQLLALHVSRRFDYGLTLWPIYSYLLWLNNECQ